MSEIEFGNPIHVDYGKKYKEALEKAKDYHKQLLDEDNPEWAGEIENIFPELAESEDEKIRKNLIELFHDTVSNDEIFSDYGLDKTEVLAWLEKQEKPKWSDEDEHRLKDTIYFLDTAKKHYASTVELDACIDWLKSIKQRMEE